MKLRSVVGGFSDEGLVEGGEQARLRERDELRRRQRLAAATALRKIALEDLTFLRFGFVEHVASGERYRVLAGEVDARYTPATAVTADKAGDPIFLEPAT